MHHRLSALTPLSRLTLELPLRVVPCVYCEHTLYYTTTWIVICQFATQSHYTDAGLYSR